MKIKLFDIEANLSKLVSFLTKVLGFQIVVVEIIRYMGIVGFYYQSIN